MPRPAKFSTDQILDATAQLVAQGGPPYATVAAIADRLGAPTGSIYHRFDSRDLLLARLWVRTAQRAQEGFVEALQQDDLETAAVDAALHMPRWTRTHLEEASVMLLYRREDLAEEWPRQLGPELSELNKPLERTLKQWVKRRFGSVNRTNLARAEFALLDVPYAAVRRHLMSGAPPPVSVDELVADTARCILGFETR